MMSRAKDCVDNHYLLCSLITTAVIGTGLVTWSEKYGGKAVILDLLMNNRSPVYAALASIFGSLLGFVIAAVSIAVGLTGSRRLDIVRKSVHYPKLWAAFNHATRALGFATLVALAALILDRDSNPILCLSYATAITSILTSLLLYRSIWVLEMMVSVIAKP